MRRSGRVPDSRFSLVPLVLGAAACQHADGDGVERTVPLEAGQATPATSHVDERAGAALQRSIVFEEFGLTVELDPRDHFRNDGFVEDLDQHQAAVLAELYRGDEEPEFMGPALNARTLSWTDAAGSWAISFALRAEDERLSGPRLVHEEVHALTHLAPERLADLYLAIEERGFAVDWDAHDEETRCLLVEVVAILEQGVTLEALSGSEGLVKAVEILKAARERAR